MSKLSFVSTFCITDWAADNMAVCAELNAGKGLQLWLNAETDKVPNLSEYRAVLLLLVSWTLLPQEVHKAGGWQNGPKSKHKPDLAPPTGTLLNLGRPFF